MKRLILIAVNLLFTFSSYVALGEIPSSKSLYDFEEGTGTETVDQGSLANNGSFVGDFIQWSTGGVISETGDPNGCIEIFGDNFAGLSYVKIPYQDYLNSPDYTLSAWVQWIGEPNWGYLFWAGGEEWVNQNDANWWRVDLWWNANNLGNSSLLHMENAENGSM